MRENRESVRPLAAVIAEAVARSAGDAATGSGPLVRRSEHADFQSDIALSSAQRLGKPPRVIGADIAEHLSDGVIAGSEVSGPGFVNITVADRAIWQQVAARLGDERLGAGLPCSGERIVVDYSSPNIAKQMHVGHLRTTIIGDALVRVLTFLGADVIRQNHVGDWGTQFGMLIQYLDEHPESRWQHDDLAGNGAPIEALDRLYRQARQSFDSDAEFADRSRSRVVALQSGDPATTAMWASLVAESERAFQALYDRLGVLLSPQDVAGESTYNGFLDEVAGELERLGIAQRSEGALCVFAAALTGPDGSPVPLIVRKSDGGYGYAATDLATLRYRVRTLGATKILYVVDARQAQHFEQVFATARRAGWLTGEVEAIHVLFGTVLGADGKPFKTRSGSTVPLTELLDSAVDRARKVVGEKAPHLDPGTLDEVAEAAGIGSVKYADLSGSRIKDYVFDVDRMVNFTGNTGVYLQYAHARIRSILRKAPGAADTVDPEIPLAPAERTLALLLDEFDRAATDVAETLEPHRLAGYLYALAQAFTTFYEACPVLKAEDPSVRQNRIALCTLSGDTLVKGLELLGIAAPQQI